MRLKFNPNHAADGKFASGGAGVSSVSTRAGSGGVTVVTAELASGKGKVDAIQRGDKLRIVGAEVDESERGKGLGKRLYLDLISHAQKNSLTLESDSTVEVGAVRVWKSLARAGHDVQTHPDAKFVTDSAVGDFAYTPDLKSPVFSLAPKPAGEKSLRLKFNPNHDALGRFASGGGTGSAKFKKWFGDSKVVDDDGNPLVVHHGTTKEFSEFARSGSAHTEMLGFDTYFFTDNKAVASTYAPGDEGRLVDSYLKIERPLEIDAKGSEWHESMGEISEKIQTYRTPQEKAYLDFKREVSEKYAFEIEFDELPAKVAAELSARSRAQDQHILDNKKLYSEAKRQPHHYDGIIIKNSMDMTGYAPNDRLHEGSYNPFSTQYVVFKPSQIKSASKNSGEFSDDDNDFTKSVLDLVTKFNPNHDAKGRFASGSGGGAKASPAVRAWADKKFALTEHADAFVKWFGDSKVVNDAGEPLTVYHGTNSVFDEFDGERIGERGDHAGRGFYLSTSTDTTAEYSQGEGGSTMPLYVSMQQPFDASQKFTDKEIRGIFANASPEQRAYLESKRSGEKPLEGLYVLRMLKGGQNGEFDSTEVLKKSGFDGIVHYSANPQGSMGIKDSGHGKVYVAFHSNQIKSATGNVGTFDISSNDIGKSVLDLATKFNPNHDHLGRFASGGSGGSSSSGGPSVKPMTSGGASGSAAVATDPPASPAFQSADWKATHAKVMAKVDAALTAGDSLHGNLSDDQKKAYRAAFTGVTNEMNHHSLEVLEKNLDGVNFYVSAKSLTDQTLGPGEKIDKGSVIMGAWSHTMNGNGTLKLDGGEGVSESEKFSKSASQQVYAHEISHAIDWVPPKVIKESTYKLKVAEADAAQKIRDRIDQLPFSDRRKFAEKDKVERMLDDRERWHALGVDTSDLYAVSGERERNQVGRRISASLEWSQAFRAEIAPHSADGVNYLAPLSKYATTSPCEGFAEFGRLVFTSSEHARKTYPQSWAVWEKHGLVGNKKQGGAE